jgi:hypothetical protein
MMRSCKHGHQHPAPVSCVATAAAAAADCRHLYLSNCAIGISAVLFALKVVLNHDAPTYSSFMGFTLPTKVSFATHLFRLIMTAPCT